MLYTLEYGQTAEYLIKMMKRSGEKIPDHLSNPPELELGLAVYLTAFFDLDTERHISQGVIGRIPWTSIVKYAEVYRFNERQRDALIYFIRDMDAEYIKYTMKQTENKRKSNG